jgi:tetratricopeptide (TPR) repeat protein
LQPDYAVAYARLSRMWRALAAIWLDAPEIPDGYARARSAAEQAVRLAPGLGEGYLALAWVQETRDFDFDEAEVNVRKALELAPGDAESKSALAYIVASRGRMAEGLEIWHEGIELNPYVGAFHLMGTRILMGLGRLDEAADAARKAIEVEPSVSHAHTYLVMIDLARGDLAAAQGDADLEEKGFWTDFAHTLAAQGGKDKKQADASVQRFIEQYDAIAAFQVASLYALRKEPESMFAALDRAYVNKDSGLTQLLSDPFIVQYHNDPRFVAYCAKLKIDCSLTQTRVAQRSAPTDR